jgi:3-hydroxybutyryl-CoA dehydrogenase
MNFNHPRSGERLVEFMPIPETSAETRAAALAWARRIGMVPIELRREIMGFAQNRIWRAVKKECLHLVDQGYATAADIDRGWMLSYGTDIGPFGRMDAIGLHSVLRVEQRYFEATGDESDRPPSLLVALVEAGHLGVQSGSGFYLYPNPSFRDPDFLEGEPSPEPGPRTKADP